MAEDPPQRLDKALARDVPAQAVLSRTRLSRLIAEGAVLINGQTVTDQTQKIAAGDAVEITVPQVVDQFVRIITDKNGYLKPSGIPTAKELKEFNIDLEKVVNTYDHLF